MVRISTRIRRLGFLLPWLGAAVLGGWLIHLGPGEWTLSPGAPGASLVAPNAYGAEAGIQGAPYRWLPPEATLRLAVRGGRPGRYRLELRLARWSFAEPEAARLRLYSRGRQLAEQTLRPGLATYVWEWEERAPADGFLDLRLVSEPFHAPPDPRPLGVAWYGVRWTERLSGAFGGALPCRGGGLLLLALGSALALGLRRVPPRRRLGCTIAGMAVMALVVLAYRRLAPVAELLVALSLGRAVAGGTGLVRQLPHPSPALTALRVAMALGYLAGLVWLCSLALRGDDDAPPSAGRGEGAPTPRTAGHRPRRQDEPRRAWLVAAAMLAAGLLIAASPPGRFAWRVGRAAYHAARFQTGPALEALRLAWEQRPGDPLLRSQIAENLFVQGSSAIWDSTRREQALEELEEALQWEPSHLNARIFATQAALLLGELETAREHLEALDALAPDSFWAHCLRAELLAMEGDVAGAARTLQQTETLRQPYDRIAERFLEEARERLDAATRSAAAAGAAAGPGAELGAP